MLKKLKKCLKTEKKDTNIFDIVVYGSLVKGKSNPSDIDIVVIFNQGTLKERLEKIQVMKKRINISIKIDIKGILFMELFDDNFFARSGIFLEGISLFDGKPISKKIGFESFVLFVYNLKNKSHTEKVKFNYVLSGRNDIGMIKRLNGEHVAPGVVKIPIEHSLEFEDVLKLHEVSYSTNNVLVEV
tara:strand:+ start:8278 stop:8835 length:558 start_codon:yes stop_codon:yes gene_type:complete